MLVRQKIPLMLTLLLFSLVASHNPADSLPSEHRDRRTSIPVSNFFSELGDLILDVDRTIAVQSQPKVEHEANVISQLFRPQSVYFDRIQNNYKEIQKRLGKLIGNTIGFRNSYSDHELSTISPPQENFVPTIGPDYNPFAAAAEARKEKLKERISKESFEPKISIPQTIDESLKALNELSQAVIDGIRDLPVERNPSKSVGDKKDSPKRAGSIEFQEVCGNDVLEDPDLEQRRQKRCSRIAAEERVSEDLKKLMKEPKRATKGLFSKSTDTFDKGITGRSGDVWTDHSQDSMDLHEECNNEVLEDPDLEQRRQERCSRIAAQVRVREDLAKLMSDPKRAAGALFSKTAFHKLSRGNLDRSGDALVENYLTKNDGENSETMEHYGEISMDECSGDAYEDVSLENDRRDKCARKAAEERLLRDLNTILLKDPDMSQKWYPVDSKAMYELSSFVRRSGDIEDKSSGDVFSDLSLDKVRELVKDHGSWILDYPLLKRWRQRNASIDSDSSTQSSSEETGHKTEEYSSDAEVEPTEFYLPVSTDSEIVLQKSGDVSVYPKESYYRIVNENGEVMEEEIDFVLHPESLSNEIEAVKAKESVILAFTSDGVPLKVRFGPEIDNPIQHLHKVLQSAGVSLNIPVESYDDLEPVGKEVLKLGSGVLTRAVLIDASNSNELKSLLKALMVSKSSGKTQF